MLGSVLVANACMDSRLNLGEPGVLCMLDIEKTHDHVHWEFTCSLLLVLGRDSDRQ